MIRLFLIIIISSSLSGCFKSKKDDYHVFVYLDSSNMDIVKEGGIYDSLEKAREVAQEMLYKYPNGTYEIAKNRLSGTTHYDSVFEDSMQ